jgi:hypothetical protein
MGSQNQLIAKLAAAALAVLSAAGQPARAEPVVDRILSHYQLATKNGCMILKINFNIRIRYISHFPLERGDQLSVIVKSLDPRINVGEALTAREALRPPANNAAAIQSIVFETRVAQGPALSLQFSRPMAFDVAAGKDFQSLLIALSEPGRKPCTPLDPFQTDISETDVRNYGGETVATRRKPVNRETVIARREPVEPAPSSPALSGWETESEDLPRDPGDGASSGVREARTAMKQGDMARAIAILKRTDGPDALELLGVAYQKNKQMAEAKAAYHDYLRRYGNEGGAEGVRQRLAGIETAQAGPVEDLKGSPQEAASGKVRDTSYWTISGSASEFYVRDDSYQVVRDPTQPLNLNDDPEDHRVHRNVLLSNLDVFAAWGNNEYKSKFRFSGTEEHGFSEDEGDIVSVAALYYETNIKDWGTTTRIGRQTRSSDGVLGRFDGGFLSWQGTPWLRFNVVGGSPVASRKDEPFKDEKYFYGASVNFGPVLGGFDASLFAIEQRDRDIVDRRAVGTELRYTDTEKSAFLTVDYDVYFNELNAAIFSGSWTLPDKSSVRVAADYRKSPYLSTWTAIQGTQYKTLYDLLLEHTLEEAKQAAADRTATYKSASVGYTRQLSDKLQLNLDVTAVDIDGTISSFGVDALPATGTELFYSAQLVGNNLLTDDDLWTAGFRYSDLDASQNYAVDLSTRYSVTKDLRVSPRVLLSYQEGKDTSLEEYTVLPSLLLDYFWTKDLNLELEVGTRFTWRQEDQIDTRDTEFFITAGFRYDFYAGSDRLK